MNNYCNMHLLMLLVAAIINICISHCNICPVLTDYKQYLYIGSLNKTSSFNYTRIGCFKDSTDRALQPAEGHPILDGGYKTRTNAIYKCLLVAKEKGHLLFALQDGGQCSTSENDKTYNMHGPSTDCMGGTGGGWANDVYKFVYEICEFCLYGTAWNSSLINPFYIRSSPVETGWRSITWSPELGRFAAVGSSLMLSSDGYNWDQGFISLGCFKDTANRALQPAEGHPLLDGGYASRTNAIYKCLLVAKEKGHLLYAVQAGGFCSTAENDKTYNMYGPSTDCVGGKGGGWANNVYRIMENWSSITWSPELRLFVAVAYNGTDRVITSRNGEYWTLRNATNSNNWNSVTWSPELGLFVAVASSGRNNRVMTSRNGMDWIVGNAENYNWNYVMWAPDIGLFIAIASSSQLMISNDGFDWSVRDTPNNTIFTSIAWSSELRLFIALASNGTSKIMTSSDGIDWLASYDSPVSYTWSSAAWSSELGLFAAVALSGPGNGVMTSVNRPDKCKTSCSLNSIWNSTLNACAKCPFGNVPSVNQTSCIECPLGTETLFNRTQCLPCPSGRYRPSFDSKFCSRCPVGTESSSNRTTCLECPRGKYRSSLNILQCLNCPKGMESSLNRTYCMPCPSGKLRPDSTCELCPIGQEVSESGLQCIQCPQSKTRPSMNLTTCVNCPSNTKICNATHVLCLPGYQLAGNQTSCIQCPNGFINIDGDFSRCIKCPLGKQSNENRTGCVTCPDGTFKPLESLDDCIDCPIGAKCSPANLTCLSGYTPSQNQSYSCSNCEDGFFKSQEGNFGCDKCSVGLYSSDDYTTCLNCPAGYFMNSTSGACSRCGIGRQPVLNRTYCIDCAANFYKPDDTIYNLCLKCPIGATCTTTSFTCKAGYQLSLVKTGCSFCIPGYYKLQPGNDDQCLACPVGYQSNADRSDCQPCVNSYRPSLKFGFCQPCPMNSECSLDKFTCLPGYSLVDGSCFEITTNNPDKNPNPQTMETMRTFVSIINIMNPGSSDSMTWQNFYMKEMFYAYALPGFFAVMIIFMVAHCNIKKKRREKRIFGDLSKMGGKSDTSGVTSSMVAISSSVTNDYTDDTF